MDNVAILYLHIMMGLDPGQSTLKLTLHTKIIYCITIHTNEFRWLCMLKHCAFTGILQFLHGDYQSFNKAKIPCNETWSSITSNSTVSSYDDWSSDALITC